MKTYNFNLRYLEIALSKIEDIPQEDHEIFVETIEYLMSVEEYFLDFPTKFKFRLPNGKKDKYYLKHERYFLANKLAKKDSGYIVLNSNGIKLFKEIEKMCIETENAFSKYQVGCCLFY